MNTKIRLNEEELHNAKKKGFKYIPLLNKDGHTAYKVIGENGYWYALGNDKTGYTVSKFYDTSHDDEWSTNFIMEEHLRDLEFFNALSSVIKDGGDKLPVLHPKRRRKTSTKIVRKPATRNVRKAVKRVAK